MYLQAILIVAVYFPVYIIGQSFQPHDTPESYTSMPLEVNGTVRGSTISQGVRATNVLQQEVATSLLPGYPNCTVSNIIEGGKYNFPLDPIGAAGKSRLVAVVNQTIEVRSKTGRLIFRSSLQIFFPLLRFEPYRELFNPKVVYDEHEGRFIVGTWSRQFDRFVNPYARLYLAVSKNELPETEEDWFFLEHVGSALLNGDISYPDNPGLEVDEKAIYITNDMYSFSNGFYKGSLLWIVQKGVTGGLYSGGPVSIDGPFNPYEVVGSRAATTMPAQVHGAGGLGASLGTYLVSFLPGSSTKNSFAQVFTIQNPLSAFPTFTLTLVNLGKITQFNLPWAPQLGTSETLSTGGIRVLDAVWRNNTLWMTTSINPTTPSVDAGQATAHWVQFSTAGGTIKLINQGTMGGESFSSEASTYFPAIAVNKQGITAVGYSASSPSMYTGAFGSLLIGTDEVPFTVKAGLDYYVRGRDVTNRWGQYSGISVDPVDDSFWLLNQFANVRGGRFGGEDGKFTPVWARVLCTSITRSPTAPVKAPTRSPVKAPTKSPVKAPTKAPVKAPVKAPTKAPIKAPAKAPVVKPRLQIRGGQCQDDSQCGICEGDCDSDNECKGVLVCFHRKAQSFMEVPGCSGGSSDDSPIDYCVDPNAS